MNSKSEKDSIHLFNKIVFIYQNLPPFMRAHIGRKHGMTWEFFTETKAEDGVKERKGNQSSIEIVAPTVSAFEGRALNKWVCDRGRAEYKPSEEAHGFVYMVKDIEANMFYIGKKQVFKEVPLLKKEIQALIDSGEYDKRRKNKKRVKTDWQTYKTSNKALKKRIDDSGVHKNELFEFIVIYECKDETALKYYELKCMMLYTAFESERGYNENMQIKQIGSIKNLEDRAVRI